RALCATLAAPDEEIAAWLAGRLEREHAKAMRGVRAGAERAFLRWEPTLRRTLVSLRIDLEQPPAPPFGRVVAGQMRVGCAALSVELEALRDALASGIEGAQEAQTHAARLACKRLRYLIEPLRADLPGAKPLVSSLRALQAALGDLRDVQGLEARLATEQRRAEAKGSARAANLARLLRAVRAEASRRSAELESRWLEETPRDLQQSVHLLSLEAESISTSETERKYLLRALPRGLRSEQAARIEQGWLPGDRLHERLRRVEREGESTHLRTIKLGSGLTRLELEEETSSELFEALWPLTDGCRVAKRRYEIEDGGLVWIVDEFLDRDLVLAEIELPSEIIRPAIPPWMQAVVEREVTGESAYVNLRLAR
ncbi:MAG: CHAD domain-containing protein, partial [Myxococcales bacterium]|nr:CHAD domain-containing protein [Myxococcales bacterium]